MSWRRWLVTGGAVLAGAVLLLTLGSKLADKWARLTADRDRAEANADRLLKERVADSLGRAAALDLADSFRTAVAVHLAERNTARKAAQHAARKLRVLSDSAARLSAALDSAEADTTRPRPTGDDYRTAWLAERAVNMQASATIAALARDTTALSDALADQTHRADSLTTALAGAVSRITDLTSGLDTLRQATRCRFLLVLPVCVSPTLSFLSGVVVTGGVALIVR